MMNQQQIDEQAYWTERYLSDKTGWDIGYAATPLKEYIDQLTNKNIRILIPGAGHAYEAEYLFRNGFINIFVLDISEKPLMSFAKRVPEFPTSQLITGDFFTHRGNYDLILEQTFFCSFVPTPANRSRYVATMAANLRPKGILAGLWFDFPLTAEMQTRPFGGSKKEYLSYLEEHFETVIFEKCYNSIPQRVGNELFGIFRKRN